MVTRHLSGSGAQAEHLPPGTHSRFLSWGALGDRRPPLYPISAPQRGGARPLLRATLPGLQAPALGTGMRTAL